MRIILERVDKEYFFEGILDESDIENIHDFGGTIGDFFFEIDGLHRINVYLRKETRSDLCRWSKEKQQEQEKGSQKTSVEKSTKESHRNKQSRLLTQRLVEGKKQLKKGNKK